MSGVSVAYLIEQCGGLADGVNAVNATGYDGWQAFPPMDLEASTYTEDCLYRPEVLRRGLKPG